MPLISVIVVNWNGRHLLETCLPSLMMQTYDDYQVVVVDNGSTDDSLAWLRTHYPRVQIIANRENLGFAQANNQAIRATQSPYVATLNNDATPDPEWLGALVDAMESSAAVGEACGVSVDRAGIAWNRYMGEPERDDEVVSYEVFGPSACAALYRRAMLDAIGLFDETYFMYYEDVDLAWRAQQAGWRCLYVPKARVVHCHSATAGEGSPLATIWLRGCPRCCVVTRIRCVVGWRVCARSCDR